MKKFAVIILSILMVAIMFPFTALANPAEQDKQTDPRLVLRVENKQIHNANFTNLDDKVDALKALDEGTIIVRFRYTGSTIMSLFSLSNNTLPNGHFHLYITPSAIGSENRYEEPGKTASNTHVKADVTVKENEVHTVAMVVDKVEGYKYFLDGKLLKQDTTTAKKFLNNIYAPNRAELGRTERKSGSNNYPFNGEIDFAEVYSEPLADQDLIAVTGVTSKTPVQNPLPEQALITDPYNVYYPGLYGSDAYRIPSLLYTEDGTLIAGIDKRINHGGDSPANIDMMVRRSLDNGKTWESNGILINNYPGNASNIDQSLLQDKETKRIFSLVLGFPEGGGFPTSQRGTGYKTINGEKYLLLKDSSNQEFTVRENGEVYNSSNVKTAYSVDALRNLYNNNTNIGNIFLSNSPLKPLVTSYLELWHSDDEGATWEGPVTLNPSVKEEWMVFLGAGPGTGIQLAKGPHAGRLVFPVYFTNENNRQASATIYSDDHGETWHRGESPNHGRVVDGVTLDERTFNGSNNELTEAQVVELPDGQLKMFMRNYSGFAQIATSFDGGETWAAEVVTERDLIAAYCQMTAIRYDGQIDGQEAVIFASPANSTSRINGTVKVGLIKEDGTYANGRTKYKFDWKYSQLVKEGYYAYSSLSNLGNGEIGLFYEGTGSEAMSFIKFNTEYLKWQRQGEIQDPKLTSIKLESVQPAGYAAKDKVQIKAVFNHYVMLNGDQTLKGKIGDRDVVFKLKSSSTAGTEYVFEAEFPELTSGEYPLVAGFGTNLDIRNAFGIALDTQSSENKLNSVIKSKASEDQGTLATLTGPNQVSAGEEFKVQLSLKQIKDPVYAQDITVQFNTDNVDFISGISLVDGVQVVETVTTAPGQSRFLLASEGADHGVLGNIQLMELNFKAKPLLEAKSGEIRISDVTMGDVNGIETKVTGSALTVVVAPEDTGLKGDLNGDGKVSIGDLGIMAAHYGKDSSSPDWSKIKHADLNKDGKIDISDLAALAKKIVE
ncbi:hypothetical protein CA600_16610 [Paenibacillus sp. VTT E-133280]|uniref:sialidase domain-containing protein n=1 Tax=Paenibacillus sp. VTT E-133280 TaxID=1986222 RepID=UPI000BA15829|nr:sialidase domain-containing protein [Paenibacillus sp. VTT E-133280]OZQ64508.1 hypothetical protein CA600_16610 [Paenibacillus sp. VTT E-133280]